MTDRNGRQASPAHTRRVLSRQDRAGHVPARPSVAPRHDFVERAFADIPSRKLPPQPAAFHHASHSQHPASSSQQASSKPVRSRNVAPQQSPAPEVSARKPSSHKSSSHKSSSYKSSPRKASGHKAPARRLTGKVVGHTAFVGVALAFFGFALVYQSDADANVATDVTGGVETVASAATASRADRAGGYVAVLDPAYSLGGQPATFSGAAPRGPRLQLASLTTNPLPPPAAASVEPMLPEPAAADAVPLPPPHPDAQPAVASVPLPMPRPASAPAAVATGPSSDEIARSNDAVALAKPAAEEDSIFKKLFGVFQGKGPTLAFAAPDGGVLSDGSSATPGRYDRYTAVYDIAGKTLYLPNGRKLEAHSGLGSRLDDARFVHERMKGPTPPHLYDLTWREKPFHGVRAIRLNPVGGKDAIYGRTGLLVHTYLLGPNGDSNGCVSLKDYEAFMRAFENGEIKRLAVVAKL